MVIRPNSTGMVPGWSPTKIVQMVLIGLISRSQGQKKGFQNTILKNLLVWNYKAQSFHIWYIITSSRSSLPIFGYYIIIVSPWPLTFSSGERPRALWALLFFDCQGMVARIPIPEGRSVTGIFYWDSVLSAVVSHYTASRPHTGVRGIKLLHDNAPAHKSVVVKSYLSDNSIDTLPHPAYSPDLAPCDFWLNPYIKNYMRGRRFESRHAVGSVLFQCLNTIPKESYRKAFSDWIHRLEKCIHVKGEYFKGLVLQFLQKYCVYD